MDDFLQKLEKVVHIVLYGPAISQSDCRKASQYQLPYNNSCNCHIIKLSLMAGSVLKIFEPQLFIWTSPGSVRASELGS